MVNERDPTYVRVLNHHTRGRQKKSRTVLDKERKPRRKNPYTSKTDRKVVRDSNTNRSNVHTSVRTETMVEGLNVTEKVGDPATGVRGVGPRPADGGRERGTVGSVPELERLGWVGFVAAEPPEALVV